MRKVLACIQDFDLVRDLMQRFSASEKARILALSQLPQDTTILRALEIDVLLLDCTQHANSALSYAKMIYDDPFLDMHTIYLFQTPCTKMAAQITKMDEQATILYAPFSVAEIVHNIKNLPIKKKEISSSFFEESRVSLLIQKLGIPIHLNGFHYMKTAVMLMGQCNGTMKTMQQLYREIARIHNTTASRVEKAMRNAIHHAYHQPDQEMRLKPTNSQLIHHIYEQMRIAQEQEENDLEEQV